MNRWELVLLKQLAEGIGVARGKKNEEHFFPNFLLQKTPPASRECPQQIHYLLYRQYKDCIPRSELINVAD